nr:unnamed protein product [Callosobruchus analis]
MVEDFLTCLSAPTSSYLRRMRENLSLLNNVSMQYGREGDMGAYKRYKQFYKEAI